MPVVVDPFSAPYLTGTEIDWVEGLQAGFAINNPNVSGSCGCGHSFQVEEGETRPRAPPAAAQAAGTSAIDRAEAATGCSAPALLNRYPRPAPTP